MNQALRSAHWWWMVFLAIALPILLTLVLLARPLTETRPLAPSTDAELLDDGGDSSKGEVP